MIRTLAFWTAISLLFVGAPAAATLEVTSVEVSPPHPYIFWELTILIDGQASGPVTLDRLVVEDDALGDNIIGVHLAQDNPCLGDCAPDMPFHIEIPFGSSPHELRSGIWEIRVYGPAAAGSSEGTLEQSLEFGLGGLAQHQLRPEIYLNPPEPTDNDRLQLLIPTEPSDCGWQTPAFRSISRQGNAFTVYLEASSGFNGSPPHLPGPNDPALNTPAAKLAGCGGFIPFLHALPIDLGVLEAGDYSVDVIILDSDGPSGPPLRVAAEGFTIRDAPDRTRLQGQRFDVRVEWRDYDENTGVGRPVPGNTDESTLFSFFDRRNWELMIKVLDGCEFNDHFWVFGAAATDVEYTIQITDTQTGEVWTLTNPLGNPAPAINDTTAFATCH